MAKERVVDQRKSKLNYAILIDPSMGGQTSTHHEKNIGMMSETKQREGHHPQISLASYSYPPFPIHPSILFFLYISLPLSLLSSASLFISLLLLLSYPSRSTVFLRCAVCSFFSCTAFVLSPRLPRLPPSSPALDPPNLYHFHIIIFALSTVTTPPYSIPSLPRIPFPQKKQPSSFTFFVYPPSH